MTISKKSTLLSCVIIIAVPVLLAASYISVTADIRRGMEDALEGMDFTKPQFAELENIYSGNSTKAVLVSAGLTIAAALIYMYFINYVILRPLEEISSIMESISSGSVLNQRMKDRGNDEIDGIAKTFNAFMDEMMKTAAETQNTAAVAVRALSEAELTMDASYKSVKEVSDNVKSFSSAIAAQVLDAESFEEMSSELLKDSHCLSTRISEASDVIDKITDSRRDAERNLSALTWRNSAGTGNNQKAAEEISELNSQITAAAQIAGEIKTAAEQTRRLSGNALRETTSAGEYGKGFAAVFGMLNRLSGQTVSSALKIERLITSMNQIHPDAVAEVLKVSEDQSAYAKDIKKIFSNISSEIDNVNSTFGSVHKSLSAVASINVKMRELARTIQEAGLENKRNAESIEAAIKLHAKAIENSRVLSYSAASAMKELKGNLDRFKTNANKPGT